MSILWDFGDQKPLESEPKSQFTPSADAAFDEFFREYLTCSNSLFINSKTESSKYMTPTTTTNIQINTMQTDVYVNRSPKPGDKVTVYKPEIEYIIVSPRCSTVEDEQKNLEDVLEAYKNSCRSKELKSLSFECTSNISDELDKFFQQMKIENIQNTEYFNESFENEPESAKANDRYEQDVFNIT